MITEKKNKKYAGQVVDIARRDSRLSFLDCLKPMTDAEGYPYLNVFSMKSIYFVTLFSFEENRSVTANLPLDEFLTIKKHTEYAEDLIFQETQKPRMAIPSEGPKTEVPQAFRALRMGKLAGKTPGDLILTADQPQAVLAMLNSQLNFLKANLQKFKGNAYDIAAIEDALACHELGTLQNMKPQGMEEVQNEVSSGRYTVYKSPVKYQKHKPWNAKRNAAGQELFNCYSLEISCDPGRNHPYKLQIMNCLAPIGQNATGMTPILLKQAEDIRKREFDMTEGEWLYVIDCLEQNRQNVRNLWYSEMRKRDDANRYQPNQYQPNQGFQGQQYKVN